MNKFAEWMHANDKKQTGVSKKLGISQPLLHDILKKDHIPTMRVAYEIEKLTRGAVTMYDWIDQDRTANMSTIMESIPSEVK